MVILTMKCVQYISHWGFYYLLFISDMYAICLVSKCTYSIYTSMERSKSQLEKGVLRGLVKDLS